MIYDSLCKDNQDLYKLIYKSTILCGNINALQVMHDFDRNTATSSTIARVAGFIIIDYNMDKERLNLGNEMIPHTQIV